LGRKCAEEVAENLIEIFLMLGAPAILQSDNGREFWNSVVENLKKLWPTLHIVHGKPQHSQSQGSMERANQDIELMLFSWLTNNPTKKWASGLKFVQFSKNCSLHSGIKQSSYEAMFGEKPTEGLVSALPVPSSTLQKLSTEEALQDFMENYVANRTNSTNERACSSDENTESTSSPSCSQYSVDCSVCTLCQQFECIKHKRKELVDGLQEQAKWMREWLDANFPNPSVGDTVRIPIPEVDHRKMDARSILACVMEVTKDNLYRLGTRDGILNCL